MTEKSLRVLAISGSLRTDSYNRKVLRVAKRCAKETGAVVEELDLREINLPIYDGDIQAKGLPEPVKKLKAAVEAADALLLASPEYNYSVSGALKNAIDWASREGNSFDGKVAVLFGASTGLVGTLRGQFHLRQILSALNVFLLPQPQIFIRSASEAFNEDGSLRDVKLHDQLRTLVEKSLVFARRLQT